MSEQKNLLNARRAREENNSEDAKRFYDMVRTDDPDNGEAKFFYQYYALYEGKNGEIPTRFKNLTNTLISSVECVARSNDGDKLEVLKAIVNAYIPMTWSLNRYMNNLTVGTGSDRQRVLSSAEISGACVRGVTALYKLGDTIVSLFGDNGEAMNLAISAWKEAITLNQKWYAYKYEGYVAEDYAAKIQKVEPTYEMPKKAGCISFADKR